MEILVWLQTVTHNNQYTQAGKELWIQIVGWGVEWSALKQEVILCARGEHDITFEQGREMNGTRLQKM